MAPEIADQREVRVIGQRSGQRKVVMDSRDRLHPPAVAMRKTHAVDALGAADVGRAVAADRDRIVRRKSAWHARAPEQLVADRTMDHLVNLGQLVEASLRAAMHAGDELELRFAEVGGDARMGERRAKLRRMARGRQHAVGPHPQSLFFDSAAQTRQHGRRERVQPRQATGGGGGGHRILGETRLAHLTTRPRVRNACVASANDRAAAPFRAWRLCVGSRRTSQQTGAQCLSEGLTAPDEIPNRWQLRRGGPAGRSPEGLAGLHDPPPAPARGRRARVVLPLPAVRHVRHRPAAWRSGGSRYIVRSPGWDACLEIGRSGVVALAHWTRALGLYCLLEASLQRLPSKVRALAHIPRRGVASPLRGRFGRSGRPDLRARGAHGDCLRQVPGTGRRTAASPGAGGGRARRGFAGSRQRRPGERHRQEPDTRFRRVVPSASGPSALRRASGRSAVGTPATSAVEVRPAECRWDRMVITPDAERGDAPRTEAGMCRAAPELPRITA